LLYDHGDAASVSVAPVWALMRVRLFGSVNCRAPPKLRLTLGSSAPYADRIAARFERSAPRAWIDAGALRRARWTASSSEIGIAVSTGIAGAIATGAAGTRVAGVVAGLGAGVCARPLEATADKAMHAPIMARPGMLKVVLVLDLVPNLMMTASSNYYGWLRRNAGNCWQ
jgi:hypothetical protein